MTAVVRPARTADIPAIRALVDTYVPDRRFLSKAIVTLYEDVQEFLVVEEGDVVVGWASSSDCRRVKISRLSTVNR